MGEGFVATHIVREEVAAWDRPDPGAPPVASLWAGLPVTLLDRQGNWARVRCENGWETWTDATHLDQTPTDRDDDGLVGELTAALVAYQRLIDDHEAGRLDDDAFHRQALKTALVVRDTDAWLLDLASERWWRYDGVALSSVAIPTTNPPTQG